MQGYTCNTDMHVTTFFFEGKGTFAFSRQYLTCKMYRRAISVQIFRKIHAAISKNMRGQNHVHRRESDRQKDRQTDGQGETKYNCIHVDILDVDIIIIMWT